MRRMARIGLFHPFAWQSVAWHRSDLGLGWLPRSSLSMTSDEFIIAVLSVAVIDSNHLQAERKTGREAAIGKTRDHTAPRPINSNDCHASTATA